MRFESPSSYCLKRQSHRLRRCPSLTAVRSQIHSSLQKSAALFVLLCVLSASNLVLAGESDGAPKSSGTGFAVSRQGHILTNHHVVNECPSVRVVVDGEQKETPVIATDKQNDLALLKLAQPTPNIARFRKGRGIRAGDSVVVVGFPYHRILASEANVTSGAVSALAGLKNDSRFLQISAPVQPGNSGGPVLDSSGHAVGIVESKLNALAIALITGDLPQNVNFAIKDAIAMSFLDSSGVIYEMAASDKHLEPGEIGEQAKRYTYLIECYSESQGAKKRRIEAEQRAQAEFKRKQEAVRERERMLAQEERNREAKRAEAEHKAAQAERMREAKRLEAEQKAAQEEWARLAKALEAERLAAEKEEQEHQRVRAEHEASEMRAASDRVIRFHEEELALERAEQAARKGQEAWAQARLNQDESSKLAALAARGRALTGDPRYLEESRIRGGKVLALSSNGDALNNELRAALGQISQVQPLPEVKALETPNPNFHWVRIENIIRHAWMPPPLTTRSYRNRVSVQFRCFRNGKITDVEVAESSGDSLFDQSAVRAVLAGDPLPPFPIEILEPHKDIQIVFRNSPSLVPKNKNKVASFQQEDSSSVPSPNAALGPIDAFNLAYSDYLAGSYADALAGLHAFVKDYPNTSLTPNAYYWMGDSYYLQRNLVRAVQQFQYVTENYPGSEKMASALYKLGLIAVENGNLVEAKRNFRRVIDEFPMTDEAQMARVRLVERRFSAK